MAVKKKSVPLQVHARSTRRPHARVARSGVVAGVGHMTNDIRWKQRFQGFDRGLMLIRDALARGPSALSPLEREGLIKRFEFTFELTWKTVKDFLEASGLIISPVTPRQVIKDAFAAKVLSDGQVWIDMLDHRNLLSHNYAFTVFEEAVDALAARYLPAIESLHDFLMEESLK